MLLPDVNVWVAVAFKGHEHHRPAKAWFDGIVAKLYFCRTTQQGFLRLATNPKVFPEDAVSMPDAWRLYDEFSADPRIEFAQEPDGIESEWRRYTRSESFSPKVWNDAYLAAFARLNRLELVTFDQGFKAYEQLKRTILH